MPKVTLTCHPEAKPKDLANEKEILRFAQNDSFVVTLAHFYYFTLVTYSPVRVSTRITSPSLIKGGTCTTKPVSSVAGLF